MSGKASTDNDPATELPRSYASSSESWRSRRRRSRSDSPSTIRHGEPELAGGLARVVDGEDVRVLEPGGDPISRWNRSGPSVCASSGWSTLSATGRLC